MIVHTGKKAKEVCSKILGDYEKVAPFKYPNKCQGLYFVHSSKKWCAFDNSTGDCWVEEFNSHIRAMDWLAGKFEVKRI